MRKEEAGEARERKGKRREYCTDDLLETLLERPLGLNGIIEKINEDKFARAILSPDYSKGTVIKYLRTAVTDELVEYMEIDRKGVGENRRPICLTPKGKRRAERNRIFNALTILSDDEFNRFVLNYKLYVVRMIMDYFDDSASGSGFSVSSIDMEDDNVVEDLVNSIEADLRYHSFKEDEIVRMWLIDRGYPVLQVIKTLGAPHLSGNRETNSKPEYTPKEKEIIRQIRDKLCLS